MASSRALLAAVTAVGSALAVLSPSAPAAEHAEQTRVVLVAQPGRAAAVELAVRAAGGRVRARLPLVDGLSAQLPAAAQGRLARDPSVRSLTPDSALSLSTATWAGAPASLRISDAQDTPTYAGHEVAPGYARSTGADLAWAQGVVGNGVTVAVVDTGVAPVEDLAGRVVAGPDLSGEHDSTRDSYGHGTVMAGIIAGDGTSSREAPGGAHVGMAPRARVVSVKVAGRNGATDVSTVLAGLQWVGTFHAAYGIRVVNLSWGTTSRQSPTVDPLDFAVERLWRAGVVVVASAGNGGPADGTVTKPGDDPVVLTAGAYDEGDLATDNDDRVTDWSGRGSDVDSTHKPDLVAPGRTLLSTVAPGSLVALEHPEAVEGAYIRGSGTSQATATVSGAAALLLSDRPSLLADQVKHLVRSGAAALSGTAATAQGRGRLQVGRSLVAETPGAHAQPATARGGGSLEQSRGGRHIVTTCAGADTPTAVTGEVDGRCRPWSSDSWSSDSWSSDSWSSDSWSSDSWSSDSWSSDSWSSDSWSSDSWSSAFWGDSPTWQQSLPGEQSAPPAAGDARVAAR